MRIILILSILISFGANAQTTPSANTFPTIFLGSAQAGGTCSRNDTLLSFRDASGQVVPGYLIVHVTMYLKSTARNQPPPFTITGSVLSTEMQNALKAATPRKEVSFMIRVGCPDSIMRNVGAVFNLEN